MFSAIANIENVASDFGAIYSVATSARRSGCSPRRDFVGALVMALFFLLGGGISLDDTDNKSEIGKRHR
jgi:hypothetical protein